MKKIVLSVSDECYEDVENLASCSGVTPAALVRFALLFYLTFVFMEPFESACWDVTPR